MNGVCDRHYLLPLISPDQWWGCWHMDTSFSASGKDVKPRIVEQYDGKDILLNPELTLSLAV